MSANPYQAPQIVEVRRPADQPPRRPAAFFHWPFVAACVVWAVVAIQIELQDRSWGALAVAVLYGPIGNGAIAAVACCYALVRKLANRRAAVGVALSIVAAAAIGSSAVIFGAIFFMQGRSGC